MALRIDPTALSRVLSGKQVPSHKLASKILEKLDLSPVETSQFWQSLAKEQDDRELMRRSKAFRALTKDAQAKGGFSVAADLSIEIYRIIADWYHAAILELTFAENFKSDPAWIASELGISATEASLAIERLLELGLLRKETDGRLIKTEEQLDTVDRQITMPAFKKNQKQFLEKAIHSVDNDPIEERDMSFMVMNVDTSKLPAAKKMIQEFRHVLCRFLESGPRERVYNLEVALYPIQKKRSQK